MRHRAWRGNDFTASLAMQLYLYLLANLAAAPAHQRTRLTIARLFACSPVRQGPPITKWLLQASLALLLRRRHLYGVPKVSPCRRLPVVECFEAEMRRFKPQ
ncbi:uncharacterized protein K452DRAFT_22817 [Aplosporella prunicola CBS 121167]|uniref:Uncharacterized protein n=1 Tax=Aplosporella prunicola CBS 121167 TaxID=1176127 RepID=A0A6A6AW11_9PEZI|nr:uncharacterized protein K452DRAFT_22817 [Aplosporella prunicola CBS 121167]KAF2135428.1 hypothetical protein K452DRAFT_22817 [Aplosporella prunicola CBS 121167]